MSSLNGTQAARTNVSATKQLKTNSLHRFAGARLEFVADCFDGCSIQIPGVKSVTALHLKRCTKWKEKLAEAHDAFSEVFISRDRTPKKREYLTNLRKELKDRQDKGERDITIRYKNGTPRGVYLPPNQPAVQYVDFCAAFEEIMLNNDFEGNVILSGDFNMPNTDWKDTEGTLTDQVARPVFEMCRQSSTT
ncbi:hypothetical protein J6590_024395 [Homalodisca vitripennis]|nr:hypothetical protein J6590_024395 [Homalodisca vitripennis]